MWYLRDLPVAGDLPPLAPPALPVRVQGQQSGNARGSWGWAVTLEGQDPALQSRVGLALLPQPGPAGSCRTGSAGCPLGPCPAPAGAPPRGLRVPPRHGDHRVPVPFIVRLLGTRRLLPLPQEIPWVGWDFGHPRGTVLPSRVSRACGGAVGDTAALPSAKKNPKPRLDVVSTVRVRQLCPSLASHLLWGCWGHSSSLSTPQVRMEQCSLPVCPSPS